jgi:hypothetical protein
MCFFDAPTSALRSSKSARDARWPRARMGSGIAIGWVNCSIYTGA